MSVSNVNSIYGAQMGSNAGYDTPAIKIEEKESNIGAWLCGGLALVATLGVGIAAHKTGKAISPNNNDDNMFQTIWKGVKSWVGKNGDDVAKNIDDIPAECKTSLKTLFSEGKDATLTATQKQDIIDNADKISKVFSNKAGKNASKADTLVEIAQKKDKDKLKALAQFLGVKGDLILDDGTLKAASADDQAIIARKLKNGDASITENNIDEIIKKLRAKYENKQKNYNSASSKIRNLTDVDTLKSATGSTDDAVQSIIAKRLNRSGAAKKLVDSCTDTSSYINTQNSLTKWLKAGDLTQDEYDNLRAYAEQKFMNAKDDGYLNYLKQTLKKADGSEINFNSLDEASITLLNNKFKGLKLTENTKLNINDLLNWKKENTKSISEYLGLNGCSLSASDASGFKLVDGKLVWEASAEGGTAPEKIFDKPIGSNCKRTTEGKTDTRMTLILDNIKKIFEPVTA